ncbi:lysophospholipid acyltransferase [Serendipita sp. 396]|nr:lysophospholipid acyltransferase [Serendipita sp. 396]KAG8784004.1 lysophospholipid acyltransferase [Serendipita sp. 397]KAG8802608.1 lysophospholipid acyltransferase [Serendipita sp. 398]KAG8826989.1 lysophospholipid acyltransferase [Serendipita sp. 401]KAG8835510.1 lysophospholipid acyltransferase [Serendipita sp. 400]KAG8860953.1 lysophospholipid acyltransferase [Serendipita sp. 411]KAG8872216.1 lysophospholipid acyltransferase [Serendipita sp. 405]KAG9054500.1 lysophospholipid acyltra
MHITSIIDQPFRYASSILNASPDQIKLIFCLLVDYPLANIFIRLPKGNATLKHYFNLSISTFYMFGLFRLYSGATQLLACALATYFIAKIDRSKNMPWIVFAGVMGHLFINHIYRTLNKVTLDDFDITGPQMVLSLKLTSYAWSVWDGRRSVNELDKGQVAARIVKEPSLLAFLGYAFYFPAILVGHSSDLNTYMALTDGTIFDTCKEEDAKRHVPRGRKRVAYKRGLLGLVFLGIFSFLSPYFMYSRVLRDEWLNHTLLARIAMVQFIGFIERTKYYGVWKLSEGACIVTGLGFSGYDAQGNSTWDNIANVNIPWVELAPNFKILLDSWNIRTNIWLRECVYKRVTPQGTKPGFQSTFLTFFTSAVWHGTYSGYYLTFLFGGFVQPAARLARTYLRPLFLSPLEILPPKLPDALAKHNLTIPAPPRSLFKIIYDVLGTVVTILVLNYVAGPFTLWYWNRSLEAWRRMGWYGFWIIGLAFVFFYGGGGAACKRLKEERVKRAPKDVAKEIVGENYIHPTLRTDEMKGTGLQNIPPVDQVALEIEELVEKLVDTLRKEALKKQR